MNTINNISDITFHEAYHYVTQDYSKYHNGIDYGTNRKKIPIYPIEDGIVTYTGKDSYGALIVKVKYNRINKTFVYGHLDKITVEKGQKVNEQTMLGLTGKTGNATGIHLHLSIYDNKLNKYINPNEFNYTKDNINYYIVKKGDNLSKIAKKFNTTWINIYNKNKNIIGNNPNLIYPGQKLIL